MHQPIQLRITAGELKQESDRYRKTTSASKLIEAKIEQSHADNPTATIQENRTYEMNTLKALMDEAFNNRTLRLTKARDEGNTTTMWKIISSAVE